MTSQPRTSAQARRRRAVARSTDVCPGWGVPPHRSTDMTADHVIPTSQGGEDGPLVALCRRCNGRRGDKPWSDRPCAVEPPRGPYGRNPLAGP